MLRSFNTTALTKSKHEISLPIEKTFRQAIDLVDSKMFRNNEVIEKEQYVAR